MRIEVAYCRKVSLYNHSKCEVEYWKTMKSIYGNVKHETPKVRNLLNEEVGIKRNSGEDSYRKFLSYRVL